MALTGRFNLRKSFSGRIILQVEEELDVRSQGVVCRVSDEPMRLLGPGFADVLVGGEAP